MKNRVIDTLTYKMHSLGFYYYYVKYYYQDNKKTQKLCIIKGLLDGLKLFNIKNNYYEYLEIPITTKCSLKCKHCSNLIPCYKKQSDYDIKILTKSIKEYLKCINKIVYIRILGGEPFLSDNLSPVLSILQKSNKIQRIEIVTNGTIIPTKKELIQKLKNKKTTVCISQYPIVNNKKIVSFLKKNKINYRIDKMSYWMNYGNTKKRNKNKKELKKQFKKCNHICKSLINGQLHLCPRSSHGTDLGIIKNNEKDYVNLIDKKTTIKEKQHNIHKLFKKKYIKACNYCDYGTKMSKKIPVAEQIKYKKIENK